MSVRKVGPWAKCRQRPAQGSVAAHVDWIPGGSLELMLAV
jgi:hypothetical protein